MDFILQVCKVEEKDFKYNGCIKSLWLCFFIYTCLLPIHQLLVHHRPALLLQ